MTPRRPYLIRALYEWILDNDSTPYMLVNALDHSVEVPVEHVKDGQIVLNISPIAVQSLTISNEAVEFQGRFAGVPRRVFVPVSAVMGIYAKENGQGMLFEPAPVRPAADDSVTSAVSADESGLKAIEGRADSDQHSGGAAGSEPRPNGGSRPTLKVVK
jgi:stringent starvation protein B